ncbi:hypothetical protein EVJ32_04555 [Exiguobacterium sp. SH5S4]|uniref:hypothetical protein n=1 Tax=Exiguobacterium sp. SH5S4 TaxID=2510961 RepID=UPI00103C05CE|nr:hypothetical protein [Exiguobacterium sp. SH5S4]TCI26648.1 hypothetical protein EVJ32_04555 [Exiguobacterium sp. SH5S4]
MREEVETIIIDGMELPKRFEGMRFGDSPFEERGDIQALRELVHSKLNYLSKYGEERNELVSSLLGEVDFLEDIMSAERTIIKEHKKASSFLSEDQTLDKTLATLADYILFTKFDSEEQERAFLESLSESTDHVFQKRPREYDYMKRVTDTAHEVLTNDFSVLEATGKTQLTSEQKLDMKRKRSSFKLADEYLDEAYWDTYKKGNEIPFYHGEVTTQQEVFEDFKRDIDYMRYYLGVNETKDMQDIIRQNTIKAIEKESEGKELPKHFTPERQYNLLRKTYSSVKGEYEIMKRQLVKTVTLSPDAGKPVYDINSNTYYEKEDGEIVEVSTNAISLGDLKTYRPLLTMYAELWDKYDGNYTSDWYWLLWEFKRLLDKAPLTTEERDVCSLLIDAQTQSSVAEKLGLSTVVINRMVNSSIPKKVHQTYLEEVDEHVYTHKLKGKYKTCTKCGETKLISNDRYFQKNTSSKDGFRTICKKCSNS